MTSKWQVKNRNSLKSCTPFFAFVFAALSMVGSVAFAKNNQRPVADADDAALRSSLQERFRPDFDVLAGFASKLSEADRTALNRQNIDSTSPESDSSDVSAKSRDPVQLFARGTGTRGGGSGVITIFADGTMRGEILDLYRSRQLDKFKTFFATDPSLASALTSSDEEEGAKQIETEVLRRLGLVFPKYARIISKIASELPITKWTPAADEFPLIDDYIGDINLNSHGSQTQKHVQIAFRRANQIIYNEKYYLSLDALNRAALHLHEWVYALSSSEQSIQTQRFISLIFSNEILKPDFNSRKQQLMIELGMLHLAYSEVSYPAGVQTSTGHEIEHISSATCGLLKEVRFNPGEASGRIYLNLDENQRQFSIERFNLGKPEILEQAFAKPLRPSKSKYIIVSKAEMIRFVSALYIAKFELSQEFPIYLYPAQNIPADIICVDASNGMITSVQLGLQIHRERNTRDLDSAKLEAEYFRILKEARIAILSRTQTNLSSNQMTELNERILNLHTQQRAIKDKLMNANSKDQIDQFLGPGILLSGEFLGYRTIQFTTPPDGTNFTRPHDPTDR